MQIIELKLKTDHLDAQRAFFTEVLRLPLLDSTADSVAFQAGSSRLVFERETGWKGVYHFAFDVPENQLQLAKNWLETRVPISREGSDEIVHFEQWNAHAFYFFDPEENILEFIARHNQPNASDRPFDEGSILSISEIGLTAENVPETVEAIDSALGVGVYSGAGGDQFTAVGDELGLFITVKRGRNWFASRNKPAELCPVTVTIADERDQSFDVPGLPYHISMKASHL
jgi:catechol-2,3-dioxygenase